jgi:hypothetical protein
MGKSSERTVRPVSEHFYTKSPEDAVFYMTKHEKGEAVVDENVGSDGDKVSDTPAVYDRKPKYYQPANDAEKLMDKKLNFKLDFIVIVICAVNFVVSKEKSKWTRYCAECVHSCKELTRRILAMQRRQTVRCAPYTDYGVKANLVKRSKKTRI